MNYIILPLSPRQRQFAPGQKPRTRYAPQGFPCGNNKKLIFPNFILRLGG